MDVERAWAVALVDPLQRDGSSRWRVAPTQGKGCGVG